MGLPENTYNDELSDAWRNLLGISTTDHMDITADSPLPEAPFALQGDPWSQLLHAEGVEMVDLHHLRLPHIQVPLSDGEVEQALQMMQEQADHP